MSISQEEIKNLVDSTAFVEYVVDYQGNTTAYIMNATSLAHFIENYLKSRVKND